MCAARSKGISGLGPSASGRGVEHDPEEVSNLVNPSQSTLGWLPRNWAAISEKVLESPFEDSEGVEVVKKEKRDIKLDPRLLSPIDLRQVPVRPPFLGHGPNLLLLLLRHRRRVRRLDTGFDRRFA